MGGASIFVLQAFWLSFNGCNAENDRSSPALELRKNLAYLQIKVLWCSECWNVILTDLLHFLVWRKSPEAIKYICLALKCCSPGWCQHKKTTKFFFNPTLGTQIDWYACLARKVYCISSPLSSAFKSQNLLDGLVIILIKCIAGKIALCHFPRSHT